MGLWFNYSDLLTHRITEDGRFSIFDVLVGFEVCKSSRNAPEVWKRIHTEHSEVITFCDNFKFPGRGQRETPVATEEGIYQVLMLCPGKKGAEFRAWAAKLVRERREEESNPELALSRGRERAVRSWRKQGKTDSEISKQIQLIENRCHFTDTLKAHGVEGKYYGIITNEIYLALFDSTAKELKEQRGLTKNDRLRDTFSRVEVAATYLVEALGAEDIENNIDILPLLKQEDS